MSEIESEGIFDSVVCHFIVYKFKNEVRIDKKWNDGITT